MWQWLRSVVRSPREAPSDAGRVSRHGPTVAADPGDGEDESPPWVAELVGSVQKLSRGQARATARVEELEAKIEAGFADLRASLAALPAVASDQAGASPARWDALLDSIDLLVDAAELVDRRACPGVGEGLDAIARRLTGFLEQESMVRVGSRGVPLDGKLFRVVGTEDRPDLPDGVVARVVRAAVLRGGRVVREGQVIANRRGLTDDAGDAASRESIRASE